MNKYLYKIFNIIILGLLLLLVRFLYMFTVYLKSLNTNSDLSDILSKIIPPLLGAFVSGIVAITIFYLTKLKEDITKKRQSKMFLEIIENEIVTNISSVEKLFTTLKSTSTKELSPLLTKDSSTSELFKIISYNLSVELIDKFLVQLSKKDYLIISEKIKNYKSLITSLDLLNNEVNEINSKEILIDKLKNLAEYFSEMQNASNSNNKRNILEIFSNLSVTTKNFIYLLIILFFNTLCNFVLIKWFL